MLTQYRLSFCKLEAKTISIEKYIKTQLQFIEGGRTDSEVSFTMFEVHEPLK